MMTNDPSRVLPIFLGTIVRASGQLLGSVELVKSTSDRQRRRPCRPPLRSFPHRLPAVALPGEHSA
jgi:hypothetical protein